MVNKQIEPKTIPLLIAEKGDKESLFKTIWECYYPKLLMFIRPFYPGREADMEDGVQEILLRVFDSIQKFNPTYSFNTWIYRIARNYCLNKIRRHKTKMRIQRELEKDFITSAGSENPDPEEIFLKKELKGEVRKILKNLDESDQQICYLRSYGELGIKQISKIMNMPEGTIKYRMMRIRNRIKKELEGYYG